MTAVFPVLEELLSVGTSVEITVSGNSMYPMLKHQISRVRLAPVGALRIGDLPLYRRENGAYVLHRIVGRKEGGYVCCGDNQRELEFGIRREQIVAVATDYYRNDRWRSCASWSYRMYARVWIAIRPCRHAFLSVGRWVFRLLRRAKNHFEK